MLEKTEASAPELRRIFGDRVAELVIDALLRFAPTAEATMLFVIRGGSATAGAATATVWEAIWGAVETAPAATEEPSSDGAAEAGSAKEATRPPEATATAETLTAGEAVFDAMSAISFSGENPGARWRPT